ncbi:MAG: hypothetical protein V1881_00440 [Candidatus Micrarchaeota archaeon]
MPRKRQPSEEKSVPIFGKSSMKPPKASDKVKALLPYFPLHLPGRNKKALVSHLQTLIKSGYSQEELRMFGSMLYGGVFGNIAMSPETFHDVLGVSALPGESRFPSEGAVNWIVSHADDVRSEQLAFKGRVMRLWEPQKSEAERIRRISNAPVGSVLLSDAVTHLFKKKLAEHGFPTRGSAAEYFGKYPMLLLFHLRVTPSYAAKVKETVFFHATPANPFSGQLHVHFTKQKLEAIQNAFAAGYPYMNGAFPKIRVTGSRQSGTT